MTTMLRGLEMTTIAYKDGIIAYDSLCVASDIVVDSDFDKKIIVNDLVFFLCGRPCDFDHFIKVYVDWNREEKHENIDVEGLVIDNNTLYRSSIDDIDNIIWKGHLRLNNHYAIGSGRRFALAFMDAGMSAKEAIEMTAKRDIYTGGTIRTFDFDYDR